MSSYFDNQYGGEDFDDKFAGAGSDDDDTTSSSTDESEHDELEEDNELEIEEDPELDEDIEDEEPEDEDEEDPDDIQDGGDPESELEDGEIIQIQEDFEKKIHCLNSCLQSTVEQAIWKSKRKEKDK